MSATVTISGVRLAPAGPRTTPDGQVVSRVGLWPADGAPIVLDADEIALALAQHDQPPGRYGLLIDEAAVRALAGVSALGRGMLSVLAARWRDGTDPDVWPPGHRTRCIAAATALCRYVHHVPKTHRG